MKKLVLFSFILIGCLFLTGCKKYGEKDVIKDLKKSIEKSKGYNVKGELEIINNEDSYLYDVEVAYKKNDNFKVLLKNKVNNHEQIILRNSDGVYVLTPSLNKSFKFQSEWPYNNSQIYLLQVLLKDIENDDNREFKKTNDGYIITTKVNYSNNKNLVKQNIYINQDNQITDVQVLDEKDQIQMKMKFTSIDMKSTYDDNYFELKENMTSTDATNTEQTVGKLNDITYPMYLPTNTYLTSQDTVATTSGERIILTFDGEKPFMLVQETAKVENELTTIPMYGEPEILVDTVAAISDSSITWVSNGVEYYVVSDNLEKDELINVAKSISVMPIAK